MSAARSRPATRADLSRFYDDFPCTFRARAFDLNGKLVGVGGVWYKEKTRVAFAAYDDEVDKNPIFKARCGIELARLVKEKPCIAFAGTHPKSAETLEHFGFRWLEGNIYQWLG